LGDDREKKEVKIGTSLTSKQKEELMSLLKQYADKLGLDAETVVHRMPIKPGFKPV